MNTRGVLLTVLVVIAVAQIPAEESDLTAQNCIGVNVLHTVIINLVSTSLSDTTRYLPLHFSYAYAASRNLGFSALVFYRLDVDAGFTTNEFGFAMGPRFSFNYLNGLCVDAKIGLGYAVGVDYTGADYSRLDLVIELDIAYNLVLADFFAISFGVGVQTLVAVTESPSRTGVWDWNFMGELSHYYLPVANLSACFLF